MAAECINLKLPESWEEMTDSQILTVYRCVSSGISNYEMKLLCAMRFCGLSPLGENLFCLGKLVIELEQEEIHCVARSLDFLDELPSRPIRPCIRGCKALSTMLTEADFETFLVLDNYLQGYLATDDVSMLRCMADILYPYHGLTGYFYKLLRRRSNALDVRDIASLYWMTSLKGALSRLYPYFLRLKGNEQSVPKMTQASQAESIDAQLRALTKGDITKEREVKAMPYRRALTELNALARESEELRRQLKK